MAGEKITVAIMDDQPVVRHGIISILHQCCNIGEIAEACGGQAGLAIIVKLQPDIVILEIAGTGSGGGDCIAEIRKIRSNVTIIVFSADNNAEKILQAIRAGVKGYVLKTDPLEELQKALQSCLRGELYLSPAVSAEAMRAVFSGTPVPETSLHCLTQREYEIARHFSDGKNTEEVARELFISPNTVRIHLRNIKGKLSCKHTNELLVMLHGLFHRQSGNS